MSASVNPSAYGTPLTFTAIVAAAAGATIPAGTVVFWDGGNAIGSRSIIPGANSGTAILTIASLGAGVHQVWATYSGDPNYKGSESVIDVQTVSPIATTTTLSSALNPSMYGQSVTLTATVQATGGTIQPTGGTVQFWDGTALLGSASLANSNQASFSISALAAGSHSLTAVLLASANFQASTSGSITQQVVKNQTVVQLGCAIQSAPPRVHRQVVFTILVHPAGAPAYLVTEGTVTIYRACGQLVATLPVRNGQASFNRYLCQVWQKGFYAVYNGTANLGRAWSNMVRVTMSPVIAGAQSTRPAIVPKVTAAAPKATLALALHAHRVAVLRKG